VIEALGPGVRDLHEGQAVSVVPAFSQNRYAVYAEQAVVPAGAVVARPEGVDAITGAAVWMAYLTAYGALVEVAGLRPADTVLLTAASSSVGLAAIHVANRLGVRPIAVTRTRAKRDRLLDEGAAAVIVSDEEDVARRVLELTGDRGVELAFDAVAGPGVVDLGRVVTPDGTLILYGAQSGEPTPFPGFDLGMPALNVRTYTVHEITRDPERMRRATGFIGAGLRDGAFRAVIDRTFPLEEIVRAHRHMEDADSRFGKIVVTVARSGGPVAPRSPSLTHPPTSA
jgi:NADPH:quinone reductase-like Zn-dependent oxidoreductase